MVLFLFEFNAFRFSLQIGYFRISRHGVRPRLLDHHVDDRLAFCSGERGLSID